MFSGLCILRFLNKFSLIKLITKISLKNFKIKRCKVCVFHQPMNPCWLDMVGQLNKCQIFIYSNNFLNVDDTVVLNVRFVCKVTEYIV